MSKSVIERLDKYDISTSPNLQALADITIMFCLHPVEVTTLHITNERIIGYMKNRRQLDTPRKFRSLEKDQECTKELITWLQNTISSGKIRNPDKPETKWFNRFLKDNNLISQHLHKMEAVYGAVVHGTENSGHLMTLAGKCLHHNINSIISPIQNYVVINYQKKNKNLKKQDHFEFIMQTKNR